MSEVEVDLDRELYDRTVAHLREQLTSKSSELLLDWILREHKIEVDHLKAEVAGFRQANGVMGPMLHAAVSMALGATPRETEPLGEAEAMKSVNELLDEEDPKRLAGEDEDDPWAGPGCPKCGRILGNPGDPCPNGHVAPIVTVEPEPYKPEGPVSEAEKERIKRLIGVQNTVLTGEQFCTVVSMRLKNATATQIADASGVYFIGPQLRAADRHVKQLAIHPREEWREEYLRQLALACQRRNA